jgi:hypothetical protein
MAAGPKVWDNQQIEQRLAEGRGQGAGDNYTPWVWVQEFSSAANQTREPSVRLKRTIHAFSSLERAMFLWHEFHGFSDYREQFPMDRRITMGAAQALKIRHPRYPVSRVPMVMVMDALVIKRPAKSKPVIQGWDAKPTYKLRNKRVRAKLSLHRAFCAYLGVEHNLFTEKSVPRNVLRSIEWARGGLAVEDEILPRRNFLDEEAKNMLSWLRSRNHQKTLVEVCEEWDRKKRFAPGVSLRLMKILVWRKQVHIDLDHPTLARAIIPDQRLHFPKEAASGAVFH